MSKEYLSVRTRNAVRELLAQRKIQDITDLCSECGIRKELTNPYRRIEGERRQLATAYLESLSLSATGDAARLLALIARLNENATTDDVFSELQKALRIDGFELGSSGLFAKSPFALVFFPKYAPQDSIARTTRERIRDDLEEKRLAVEGRLSFSSFLDRILVVPGMRTSLGLELMRVLASTNRSSLESSVAGIELQPIEWPDEAFLRLLTESLHPDVRSQRDETEQLRLYNARLKSDGWEIAWGEHSKLSQPFVFRRLSSEGVAFPDSVHASDVLSDEYVRELTAKCETRLASGDLDGAVTIARTLLEAVLGELEERIAGDRTDYKGDLTKQFKQVTRLLKMDEERPDLDEKFRSVVRGLGMIVSGLAPLRNKMSDGHARVRKPAPHHARVVVNAAKTVSAFLVESYAFQKAKGLLPRAPISAEATA